MNLDEYRIRGKDMVEYIADYLENIRSRRVFPDVQPGYMRNLIPSEAPESGEKWENIFSDIERVIMPGMTHWQSPYMHAYFPALNSPPSLLGDMLADAIGCLGFTWASSPACTELETIVMDWLGKMIGLPAKFLHSNEQTMGGGVIQTTASEATFVSLLAARTEAIKRIRATHPDLDANEINSRLVAYCSDQAHSSVEKASLVALVKLRLLPCDEELSLRGETLRAAVLRDRKEGLIPFFLCATIGTTGACAFDNLVELGPVCAAEDMWIHMDAAYAGSAFICPEYRHFLEGAEYAQSFAFNPSKWLMVHFDCTAMWVQNSGSLHRTFNVQPLYLKHENTGAAIDYMHWQVPLSRRFRSLKLWFVLRSYGITGLQKHIREGVRLAQKFEDLVCQDPRFEIPAKRHLGLVVFRLKGENDLTELLLKRLNKSGKIHAVPASIKGKYIIRFTVTSTHTTEKDIERDWKVIRYVAHRVLVDLGKEEDIPFSPEPEEEDELIGSAISNVGMKRREGMKRRDYGISLILSNVPMSPKFINGSFAALFENTDSIAEYARHLSRRSIDFNGQPIRLSPRKRLTQQSKQYSFDLSRAPQARRTRTQRQGSLDSKIEEIIDNSLDSASGNKRCEETAGLTRNGNGNDGESEDKFDDDGYAETTVVRKRRGSKGQKVKMEDKAVQSPTTPTNNVNRSVESEEINLDSPSEGRPVLVARSPSAINGLTPLICKHCGHAVED